MVVNDIEIEFSAVGLSELLGCMAEVQVYLIVKAYGLPCVYQGGYGI